MIGNKGFVALKDIIVNQNYGESICKIITSTDLGFDTLQTVQSIPQIIKRAKSNIIHGGFIDLRYSFCQWHHFRYLMKNIILQSDTQTQNWPHQILYPILICIRTLFEYLGMAFHIIQRKIGTDWEKPQLLSLLRGSAMENKSHMPFLIVCSRHW